MKRLRNLFILILLTMSVFVGGVSAKSLAVNQKFSKTWSKTLYNCQRGNNNDHYICVDGISIPDKINELKVIPYDLSNSEVGTLIGYCIDPHLQSTGEYKVDYILGTREKEEDNKFDTGIIEILRNGYNNLGEKKDGALGDKEEYVATSIAIRALAIGLGGQGKGSSSDEALIATTSAHISAGLSWAGGKTILSTSTPGYYNKKYEFKAVVPTDAKEDSIHDGDSILNRAQELFNLGLSAATGDGDSTVPTITTKENEQNGQVTIILEYKNFTVGSGKIYDFACDNCENFKVEGDGELTSSDGTITITFGNSGEDCKPTKYEITYKYTDDKLNFVAAHLVPLNASGSQNFYTIQKNEGELEGKIEGNIVCGDACKTNISEPICESDALGSIKTDTDIKKCILDNVDDAGNPYELTNSKGLQEKNKYCSVFCKEDYDTIQLEPVVPNVKCGKYFNLNSKIEGKKTCYTGGPTDNKQIDKEQYLKDIIAAQKEMIEAYNEYLGWSTALKKGQDNGDNYTDSHETTCTSSDDEGNLITVPCCENEKPCTQYFYNVDVDIINYIIDEETNKTGVIKLNGTKKKNFYEDNDGGHSDSCSPAKCENGKPKKLEIYVEGLRDAALGRLNKAIEKYENIIKEYNSCTTAWTNEFAFAQEIKFEYDESHDTSDKRYEPYYSLIKDKNDKLKPIGEATINTSTILVCTGDTNDQYECQGEEKPYELSVDSGSLGTYNYNSGYGDTFKLMNYIKCSKDKCEVDKESYVSQALFIKKEVAKSQEYETPTAFAQIAANGKITLVGAYEGPDIQLEELPNSLPVSTSVVGGGVFKLLIQGLGEYYDEDNLFGRLIDHGKTMSNGKETVIEVSGSEVFKDEYACYYESLCRPKDCPDCIFTCYGDGCSWDSCVGDQCSDKCVGCIFNLGELSITHKTISTSNINSAGRTFGYNWITTNDLDKLSEKLRDQLVFTAAKAQATIDEIQTKNETIYGDTKDTENSEFAFSIKLTPQIITDIKTYNENQSENGGYINDSLTCYDAKIDGKDYKNIFCYSDFIDSLMEKYSGQMTFGSNRPEKSGRKDYNSYNTDNSYWNLWLKDLDLTSEDVIGGPSWR